MEPIHINNSIDQEQLAVELQNQGITAEQIDETANYVDEHFNEPVSTEQIIENEQLNINDSESVATSNDVSAEPVKSPEVRKTQNVTLTDPISYKDDWDPLNDTIVLPSVFDKEARDVLERVPNINLLDDPKTRDWLQTVSEGTTTSTFRDGFIPTLEDENASFYQSVDHNGTRLGGAQPKFKQLENQTLTGERAAIRLMSHLGLGTLFQVPLWHSGMWITFKAPTDSEIIELNRRIIADKIEMGRHSSGLAFSNTASYTTDRIVDFALDHVYDTSVLANEISTTDLKNWIDCQDIPSLIWGFVCTMYPKGFQYRRACINDPEKCNHITEEILNVSKLQWVNRLALTDWQRAHMSSRRSNSKDKASIVRYKEEMLKTQKRRILFNEGEDSEIAITLKTPTIAEYVDAGHRWISGLVELVDQTLGQDVRDQERNAYVMKHAQASSMRQYVHWVESIEMDTNVISDMESIENSFNMLSAHNEIRGSFIENVVKYINESTLAVIGIPVYNCPVCSHPQDEENLNLPNHRNIIPLDVIQLFFALLTQRLSKISIR